MSGDPPVPPDADLRPMPYMPLDVKRLRDSDLAATATGDEFRAAVLLWCAAWHQVPAASLPDDDRVLAMLAGFGRDVAGWQAVRAVALSGFERKSDGRLYHPVVVEKAIPALASKAELAARRVRDRARKTPAGDVSDGIPAETAENPAVSEGNPPEPSALNGEETERNGLGSAGDAEASPDLATADDGPLRARIYGPVAEWLTATGGRSEAQARSFLGRACRDHGDAATLEACLEAQARGAPDPMAYIHAILRGKNGGRKRDRGKGGGDGAVAEDYRADMLAGIGLGAA